MQLKKIEILKYKSINSPVTINFNHGEPVALIGKNGSGKTNILEALKRTFTSRHFPNLNRAITMQANYYFQLTDEEYKKYFFYIELDKKNGLIKVEYNDKEPTIRLVSSPIVQVCVKKFREESESILQEFKIAARNYINNLKKIEVENTSEFMLYTQVECQDDKGTLTYIDDWHIKETQRQLDEQLKSIKNILDIFKEDNFKLDDYNYSRFTGIFYPIKLYTIVDQELKISPIIAKSLGITKKKLETANLKLNESIKSINQSLKTSYKNIQTQIQRFEKLKKEIETTFSKADDNRYATQEAEENYRNLFMQDLKSAVFTNCYYIDNENTLLFSPLNDKQYLNQRTYIENFQSNNPLLEAFHIFLLNKSAYIGNETILKFSEIEPNRRKALIKLINTEFLTARIPKFDKTEIKGLLLKETNSQLVLSIRENSGAEINVNETSLGRRWYLTYLLIKSILKPGDILLIDEPAAFLHPQAQQEIKRELKELASSGIFVIYATHSPYMIPKNWGNVYNVKNTEAGTQVTQFNSDDDLSTTIKEELGITRSADILFNLDKTLLIVEGVADKKCVEKFAQLLGYDISEYKIHICDGEAILQVAYIYLKIGIEKVYMLLDNDNKYKPEYFKKSHSMYQECIDEIEKHKDKCIYIGTSETGCLEDYFKDSNNKFKRYDTKKQRWKIDVNAINAITNKNEVCTETLNNFEQLFKKLEIPPLDKTN